MCRWWTLLDAGGPTERWSRVLQWDEEGTWSGGWRRPSSESLSEWQLSRVWGTAEQQDALLLLLRFGPDGHFGPDAWTGPTLDMFDNSNYPFNCFNYDGDGYPSSSTDEDKKMCRPAYRYAGVQWLLPCRHILQFFQESVFYHSLTFCNDFLWFYKFSLVLLFRFFSF